MVFVDKVKRLSTIVRPFLHLQGTGITLHNSEMLVCSTTHFSSLCVYTDRFHTKLANSEHYSHKEMIYYTVTALLFTAAHIT